MESTPSLSTTSGNFDSEAFEPPEDTDKAIQTDLTVEELTQKFLAFTRVENLEAKLLKVSLTCDSIRDDDVKTKYYTGLQTFGVFNVLLQQIEPCIKVNKNTILSPNNQILLTVVKLSLNLDYKDLGYRFGVNATTASTYFKNVLHIMYIRLKNFVFRPSRDVLRKTMPSCFR